MRPVIRVHAIFSWLCLMGPLMLLHACAGAPERPAPIVRPAPATGSANDVLFRALGLVGTPYRYGGNTPEGGFDCSGLVTYVYRDSAGVGLPRSSRDLAALPVPRLARDELASGDLVFFGRGRQVTHVGIYVGENRFVHAPASGGTVRLDPLDGKYWKERWLFGARVLQ